MFEGGSDNYPSSTYEDKLSDIRDQGVVIVVKNNASGYATVVSYNENCSSIPGDPRFAIQIDGTYPVYTWNHQGKYGALQIDQQGKAMCLYAPDSNPNGSIGTGSGMNIHTRSSNKAGGTYSDGSTWYWSEGCQVLGTGNDSSNYFNEFMKVVAGINYNVWTNYSSKQLSTLSSTGQNVGYYVIDRQLAKEGLKAIYNGTAISKIVATSNKAAEDSCDTPPVISNVQIIDMDKTGYTISCTVTDDTGVDRVQFPTWTDYNGQDDLFSDWSISPAASGTKNGDTYTYRVNIADHNNETQGYITHIYAFDNYGHQTIFDDPVLQYISVVCNHNFTNYESNGDATCTEDGTMTAKCDLCDETSTVTDEGSALGHDWIDADCDTPRTCDRCGETEGDVLGHSYESEVTEGNCQTPGFTTFTCTECGDTYTVYDGEFSEWSTTKPTGTDEDLIETKTQYRYADKETTASYDTSLGGWTRTGSSWQQSGSGSIQYVKSWPSGFSTSHGLYSTYNQSAKSASETETDKTVINSDNVAGYLYYHWCRGSYANGPINRGSRSTQQGEFTAFHAFYSTTSPGSLTAAPDGDGSYQYANGDCCKDTYWYFYTPVNTQTYTTYRNLFTYERWGSWSDWSDTVYSASESRKVESRTLYRYFTPVNDEHQYSDGYCTVCGEMDPDYEFVPAVITPDNVSGVPGSTVIIPIMIEQNPGFSGFTFVIDYDNTALSLTNISKGDVLAASESGSFTKNVSGGVVTWTDIENLTENGVLLELTFTILDSAGTGDYEIRLGLKDGYDTNFVNVNSRPVHVEFVGGTVSVVKVVTIKNDIPCRVGYWDETSGKYVAIAAVANGDGSYSYTAPSGITEVLIVVAGDTNGDGTVTAADIARLNAHLKSKTKLTAEEMFAADVNGDGMSDESDKSILSNAILGKELLKWEVARKC